MNAGDIIKELRKSKKEEEVPSKICLNYSIQDSNEQSLELMRKKDILHDILSESTEPQLSALQDGRRCLTISNIDSMISRDIIPMTIDFLKRTENPHLQREIALLLTNAAARNQAGFLEKLLNLLKRSQSNIVRQAVWPICEKIRKKAINNGDIMPGLVKMLNSDDCGIIAQALRSIANLIIYSSRYAEDLIKAGVLSKMKNLLKHRQSVIVIETSSIISLMTTKKQKRAVINAGILPSLINSLYDNDYGINYPALRCIGNIANGTDEQIDAVIKAGFLNKLKNIFETKELNYFEPFWTLRNITAGKQNHIQAVIDSGLFSNIYDVLKTSHCTDVQREAINIIHNATIGGTPQQIVNSIDKLLWPLSKMLKCASITFCDTSLIISVLALILRFINLAEKVNRRIVICNWLDTTYGWYTLELLADHTSIFVSELAKEILAFQMPAKELSSSIEQGSSMSFPICYKRKSKPNALQQIDGNCSSFHCPSSAHPKNAKVVVVVVVAVLDYYSFYNKFSACVHLNACLKPQIIQTIC
uniref:Importin subunit alpha n=1 Tax=Glossina brevipalpis TaxID=37001 RepID=A0A1A9WXP2_9MUSC